MSVSTTFHVRIPADLKKKAQAIAERNGIDLPTAVRLFFTHMVTKGTMPLPWLTVNGFAPEAEAALLKQIENPDIVGVLKTEADIKKYFDEL